jgi:hypothetical protein
MDGTIAPDSYSTASLIRKNSAKQVGGCSGSVEAFSLQRLVELPLVQILVVVANTQVRTLRTEVEKGSM